MPPKRPPSAKNPIDPKSSQKSERNNSEDFSSSIKKKLSASTRTGQACDRCKVRKIRCDGRTGGCSPCLQANTECRTTDRITGRATARGHTETLETENRQLRAALASLQQQLKDLGVDAKPIEGLAAQRPLPNDPDPQHRAAASTTPTSQPIRPDIKASSRRPLPKFRTGHSGDNYLGVSYGSGHLTSIHGTALQLFGMEVDLADLVADDEFGYKMSYDYVVDQIVARQPPDPGHCALPTTFEECEGYANWYFRNILSFVPILDRRAFMHLLVRIYHYSQWAELSTAERVMVQMMLATIKYHWGSRSSRRDWLEQSHGHFKYALSCFTDLMRGHQLEDVQALSQICVHLRSFPKPGASWIITGKVFSVAVEMGLHRSAQAWAEPVENDPMVLELRKRTFWSLHTLQVCLSGKLGRPMPIRLDDIDIEFPEPIDDSLPSETNLAEFSKCSFRVGILYLKLSVLFNRMYSTIYAVRTTPLRYEQSIKKMEDDIRQWEAQIPKEFNPEHASDNERAAAFYLRFWNLELHLLTHHPALCRSKDPELWRANLDACLSAATKMLFVVQGMEKDGSADLVWTNCTVYLAALFTVLFAASQEVDQMTPNDYNSVQDDADAWVAVIAKAGLQLGSGDDIGVAVRRIADSALSKIREKLAKIQAEKQPTASESNEVKPPKPPEVFFHLPPSMQTSFPEPNPPQPNFDTGPYGERSMSDLDQPMSQGYPPSEAPPVQTPHQMPHSMTSFEQSNYPTPFHSLTFATLGRGASMPSNLSPMTPNFPNSGPSSGGGSEFMMTPMNTSLNVGIPNHGALNMSSNMHGNMPSNMQSNSNTETWSQWPTGINAAHLMSSQPDMSSGHGGGHMGTAVPDQNQQWPEVLTFGKF